MHTDTQPPKDSVAASRTIRVDRHGPHASLVAIAAVVAFAFAAPAGASRVAGGGDPRTDCYAELEVDGADVTGRMARCTDGDPRCDADGTANDSCAFRVGLSQPGGFPADLRSAERLTTVKARGAAAVLVPARDSSACGASSRGRPAEGAARRAVRRPGKRAPPDRPRARGPRTDRDDPPVHAAGSCARRREHVSPNRGRTSWC